MVIWYIFLIEWFICTQAYRHGTTSIVVPQQYPFSSPCTVIVAPVCWPRVNILYLPLVVSLGLCSRHTRLHVSGQGKHYIFFFFFVPIRHWNYVVIPENIPGIFSRQLFDRWPTLYTYILCPRNFSIINWDEPPQTWTRSEQTNMLRLRWDMGLRIEICCVLLSPLPSDVCVRWRGSSTRQTSLKSVNETSRYL